MPGSKTDPRMIPRAKPDAVVVIKGKTWNLLLDNLIALDEKAVKAVESTSNPSRPWQVTFVDGGINIQVPVCVLPGSSPAWTIASNPVDFLDPSANVLTVTGRKFIILELTVDDTGPLQIDVSGVEIKAVAEGDETTQTLTTRRIPICGVDMDEGYVTPSYLSGAIQIRRWGNRNDANNLIWQVT